MIARPNNDEEKKVSYPPFGVYFFLSTALTCLTWIIVSWTKG